MNFSGSDTSSPVCVKLINRAIAAGISTERLNSVSAGARKAQAVRLVRRSGLEAGFIELKELAAEDKVSRWNPPRIATAASAHEHSAGS